MSNEITGTIIVIEATENVSATFQKREFVIEVPSNKPEFRPELIKLEAIQDRCDALDRFQIGQEVTVLFYLKGRKWTNPQGEDKYFNTLQLGSINARQNQMGQAPAPYQQPATPQIAAPAPNLQETIDDTEVPF